MLCDTLWECSRTVIPRRNDEESAFRYAGIVLKSRFFASLRMTGRGDLRAAGTHMVGQRVGVGCSSFPQDSNQDLRDEKRVSRPNVTQRGRYSASG